MELENQTQTVVNQETSADVSTDDTTAQDITPESNIKSDENEFKLPTSKEEYDTLVKSAVNRANTEILKALGVKSIKEFKEVQAKATEALTKFEELAKRNEELTKTYESVSHEYETLKQTSILDRLAVKPEYREDLVKLAKDKIDENNSFEKVLQEMVEGKYSYTVTSSNAVVKKIGTEKTTVEAKTEVEKYLEKFKGTPYYKPNIK